jgi:multidrug efflux pump subunit AcrA (membrane-fusion protein)
MKKVILLLFLSASFGLHADTLKLAGTVVSDGQKMIGSRYMGYIKKVFVKVGDRVEREDDLYEIESAEFDMMKSQADLMVDQSKIVVQYWRDRLDIVRKKKLKLQTSKKNKTFDFTDISDFNDEIANIETMLESMKIMVKQATIKAKQLSSTYNYLKMKAPSDGIIVQRNIKVGDMVMPGMLTVLMVDLENLEVEVSISESIIGKVHVGKKVVVEIPSISFKTIGVVHAVVPNVNRMTHKIMMRVKFDQGDATILPGMYEKVII